MKHYAAVHMVKLTHSALGGVLSHDFRTKEKYGSNPDIEHDKSTQNIYSHSRDFEGELTPEGIKNDIEKRVAKTTGRVNSRSVMINEFIITSDKEAFNGWDRNKLYAFYKDTTNFFQKRYNQNCAYATLHLDEKTPHIHLGLMPITKDNQLCSKKIFNRMELIELQKDFVSEVGSKYGLEKGDGKGHHHLNTKDFKRITNYMNDNQKAIMYGNFLNKLYNNPNCKKPLIQEIHKLHTKGAIKNSFLEVALNSSSCGGAIQKDPIWQELEEEERKKQLEQEQEDEMEIE